MSVKELIELLMSMPDQKAKILLADMSGYMDLEDHHVVLSKHGHVTIDLTKFD